MSHSCSCGQGSHLPVCEETQRFSFKSLIKENRAFFFAVLFFAAALFLGKYPAVQFVLSAIAWILAGGEVALNALKHIGKGNFLDENFLMFIATLGAFILGQYPEGAAVMVFYQIGERFQHYAAGNSRRSIKALLALRPAFARVWRKNKWIKTDPQSVQPGEKLAVYTGERVPLDALVEEGTCYADTSALTGESIPRLLKPGSQALSGFICKDGKLILKVLKPYSQSATAKILELVEHAAQKKAKAESFISRFARWYTPAVVGGAVLMAIAVPLCVPGESFKVWAYRGLVFLVISCPCALVLSVPLGFFGGIGGMAKNGILVKGGNYIEALSRLKILAADKTGTLTQGVFEVIKIAPQGLSQKELVEYCALAEHASAHPLAAAIRRLYAKEPDARRVKNVQEQVGKGVRAEVDGVTILVGKSSFLKENQVELPSALPYGAVCCAKNGVFAGYLQVADKLKNDAFRAISALKQQGIKKVVILTGDHSASAERCAKETGADAFFAELLPADKVACVEKLKSQLKRGETLAFAGDGVNDAPVLARADVGIAMGALGTDAAVEAADVVLMSDEPIKLAEAVSTARFTVRVVRQNIIFALLVKAGILLLGIAGEANLWEAVFADVGVSVAAVLNSIRPLEYKPNIK